MNGTRRVRLALGLGLALLALLPTTALAASANESFSGFETGYPTACGATGSNNSQSKFAGDVHGTINGVWSAAICHTDVSTTAASSVVPGGYFRVRGFAGWRYVTTSGTFVSGTISKGQENVDDAGCTQVFDLSNVVLSNGVMPTGKLVHYGLFQGGVCHVFSATIKGVAVLTY